MLSNYKGVTDVVIDKDVFEVPIGWWDKNMEDIATISIVEGGNVVIGGSCSVSKKEFLRGLLYNVIAMYDKNEVNVTLVSLDADMCNDFNVLSNVTAINTDNGLDIGINELSLDIEKRLHLLDKYGLTFNEYNKISPIKMPYRLVVLDNVVDLKESDYLIELSTKLKGECRERGTVADRLYVLDCLTNADRAGVYFVTVVDDKSYTYLRTSSMNNIGVSSLVNGLKIGFSWDIIGLNTSYSLIGKGVVSDKAEEPYNFYSSTITRVDLINKLRGLH